MNPFHYGEHALYCEGVALAEIAARVGTPVLRVFGGGHSCELPRV